MTVPVLTFFNNKGGVGKTSLVYHLAWMLREQGFTVVMVDLDAQANLTAAFMEDDDLAQLWESPAGASTIYNAIKPLTEVGDILEPITQKINDHLYLVPGDVALATFEDQLSSAWPVSLGDANPFRHFRILTAFWIVAQKAATQVNADLIMVDVGPNLGAINRSALIASDHVVIPLGADLFSLQGLKNLGPVLDSWRKGWAKRCENWSSPSFDLPKGLMQPLGYLVQQHSVRLDRPVKAYDKWVNRIPHIYHEQVMRDKTTAQKPAEDDACLATIKHYRSLIPMGQEARKPIFQLSSADGAIGSHAQAAAAAFTDFASLANKLTEKMGLSRPI